MRRPATTSIKRAGDEQGTAMIEFALLLPLLLLLTFGIIEFGRAYNAKIELTGAVREGARAAALGKTDDEVKATVAAAAPALNLAAEDITIVGCTSGSAASVTGDHAIEYTIPFFGEGTWDISATGVMRCGL
jgi:Flp pilus assembly protein TadG